MKANETELFIRSAAARSWSKHQTRTALGIGRTKFDLMVLALPDVEWAPPGKKDRQLKMYSSPATIAARAEGRAKGRASMRAARLRTVGNLTGTVPELARAAGLNPSTVNRRLTTMSLADALALPSRRNNKSGVGNGTQH